MDKLNKKAVVIIVAAVFGLFGVIELYGMSVVGDWSVLYPTMIFQLIAITVIVSPMVYGVVCTHEENEELDDHA